MSRVIRNTLSHKNPYRLSKNRQMELEYFCRQYKEFKQKYTDEVGLKSRPENGYLYNSQNGAPTEKAALRASQYSEKVEMIEEAARKAEPMLSKYLVLAVTEDLSYETMQTRYRIPCSRGYFYSRRRKFFWELDKIRN